MERKEKQQILTELTEAIEIAEIDGAGESWVDGRAAETRDKRFEPAIQRVAKRG
jgi:hypothetical protein